MQGSRVSRQPCSRSWRTMLSLTPVSIPTTCGPSPSKRTGSGGVTVRARSAPSIEGSAAIRSRASASGSSAGKMPPRIAPRSRMWRTSARVSTPLIAGTPQSREPVEPAALGGGDVLAVLGVAHDDAAGVDAVGLHRRGRDAVVADQRIGEDDDLARVGGVGDRLLVAGHRGVEDDLAGDRPGVGRRARRRSGSRPRAGGSQRAHCWRTPSEKERRR